MKGLSILSRRLLLSALILVLAGQACTLSLFGPSTNGDNSTTPTPGAIVASSTPYPVAQTTFVVTLPGALQAGESLAIATLDEVTGLSLNATLYPLNARDSLTYTATLPLLYNSVVKYRYVRRGGAQVNEANTSGGVIRYRMLSIVGPAEIHDIIAGWSDRSFPQPSGSIVGRVLNSDTGAPIPSMMVTAGGVQYITDSQGRFELSGLPVGTQQLTAYSLDGLYLPFQQGAVVANGVSTIVDLSVKPTRLVNVTFTVAVPADTVPGVPVRIAGNILQLGNTFADLQGGVSTVTDRMPIMSLQADGRYSMTLGLPIGTYIQYKYTLGDGFWNAEHKASGEWSVRDFIVPDHDVNLDDTVQTWLASKESGPILFEVSVPSVTPASDIIYIQFNAVSWMEPIPMWPLGNNKWAYQLYSPLNFIGSFSYRYCRDGQCGSADDNETSGFSSAGRTISTSVLSQDIQDNVGSWKWFENPETAAIVGATITPRASGFIAGVEYQPTFRPNWSYYAPQAFANTKAIGANLAILTPTWTFSNATSLGFATQPGQDPLWIDTAIMASQARALGVNIALFPTPQFPAPSDPTLSASASFWLNATRDAQWWQTWYTRYRAFLVNYADLAAQTGAQSLIIGGDWVTPSLPGGTLPNGNPSDMPADADMQWRAIIQDVRSHFKGQVLWAMPYQKSSIETSVSFLRDMDGIYLLWSAPLSTSQTATKTDYANEAGRLLDNEVAPLVSLVGKPVILALSYPSAAGASSDCVPSGAGGCLDFNALSRPNADNSSVSLNLQSQADIYEAVLTALNARPWISGIVSRGYYLPAALQDKSTSVHSKPAADVLWYWYPRLLGIVQ